MDVLELMQARRKQRSRPGRRQDPHRLALLIQGGGMRGVLTVGALRALHEARMTLVFDDIYGVSAGAGNATYFLAGQLDHLARIYTDHLVRFKARDHFWLPATGRQRPSEFLAYDCIDTCEPLDFATALANPVGLHIIATRVRDGQPVDLGRGDDPEGLRRRVQASMQVPVISGPPVRIDGELYVDGGLAEELSVRRALADGATHLLVLHTQAADYPGHGATAARRATRAAIARLMERWYPTLDYRGTAQRYCDTRAHLHSLQERGQALNVWATARVRAAEMDPRKLQAAMRAGFEHVQALVEGRAPVLAMPALARPAPAPAARAAGGWTAAVRRVGSVAHAPAARALARVRGGRAGVPV